MLGPGLLGTSFFAKLVLERAQGGHANHPPVKLHFISTKTELGSVWLDFPFCGMRWDLLVAVGTCGTHLS